MRFSFVVAAFTAATTILAGSASAASYYVATSGSDANNGSVSAPFKTISYAASKTVPGDVVNVRAGVYNERVKIANSGTEAARITVRAYPGEKVTIDGTGIASDKAVVSITAPYNDFQGFEVRNGPYIGIMAYGTHNVRILDNDVHHHVRNGIYIGASTVGISKDMVVSGNSVHDNVLENSAHATDGGWATAVGIAKTERSTITRNKIYNNDGEGMIALRGNYFTITDNEIFDNFSVELYIDNARYVVAERNMIYSTGNTRYYRNGYAAAGIMVANETNADMNPSSDNTIVNNIVVGSRWGFYYGSFESGGGLKNTIVAHNTFYGTQQAIVSIDNDAHSGSVFQNNIFVQTNGSSAPKVAGTGLTFTSNNWFGGSLVSLVSGLGDIIGNPLFVNAGGRRPEDYKLLPLSAAVHTGTPVAKVTHDYFGNARSVSVDMGAHEQSTVLGSSNTAGALAPPSNIAAKAVSSSLVQLTWAVAPGNAVSYNVYKNGRYFDSVQTTAASDDTVIPGTFRYSVSSVDADGNESQRSAEVPVTVKAATDTTNPSTPASLNGSAATSSTVDLTWTGATDNVGVVGYRVYRNGTRIAQINGLTFTDSGLTAGTAYEYFVAAVDAAGNTSARSKTVTVTTKTSSVKQRAARH
ncbi:MAG TPA: right-handed parallel beta-helix repeat-containing protein [Thermoanaerobaculia bacterium]|nr:right-handed parallel beta-helix repeat-containing protein [Thermoanaerobaculia bacterium]